MPSAYLGNVYLGWATFTNGYNFCSAQQNCDLDLFYLANNMPSDEDE